MASSGAEVRGALWHENTKAGPGVVEIKRGFAGVKMQRLAPGLLRSLGMTMQCTPPWVGEVKMAGASINIRGCGS